MSKRNHTFSGTIRYYLVIGSLFFLSTCTEDKPTKPNSKTPNSKTPNSKPPNSKPPNSKPPNSKPPNSKPPNSKQKLVFDQKKVKALFGNGKLDEALRRGHTRFTHEQLACIDAKLEALSKDEMDKLRGKLCIGVQQGTQVICRLRGEAIFNSPKRIINQVYGSACSLPDPTRSDIHEKERDPKSWEKLAKLVLEASYEAFLRWAAKNAPDKPVFLTWLGGQYFYNKSAWIQDAIKYAMKKAGGGLEVYEVRYNDEDGNHQKKWFQEVFGCEDTKSKIKKEYRLIDVGNNSYKMKHKTDSNKVFTMGRFSTPSLAELRNACSKSNGTNRKPTEVWGESSTLQAELKNVGATFQVASQANCLEFASRTQEPEDGIAIYGTDPSQGPACAIGCPAGTVFRNYYASVGKDGRLASSAAGSGQTTHNQLSLLKPLLVTLLGLEE